MRCPACRKRGTCIDSRQQAEWRRRRWRCQSCGTLYTSAEFVVWSGDRKGVTVVPDWLEAIRRQGAAALISELDALLAPWRQHGTAKNPGAQPDLSPDLVQSIQRLALATTGQKPPRGGGGDRGLQEKD